MENKVKQVYYIYMYKNIENKIISALLILTPLVFASCSKKYNEDDSIVSIKEEQKIHEWYYFTDSSVEEIDLPQNVPEVMFRPWTEAVRISSMASVPSNNLNRDEAYGIVNRLGVLCLDNDSEELVKDVSIFSTDTQESLVFSENIPVFYRYRSTFFGKEDAGTIKRSSRPLLVQYNPDSKMCFPLVNYENLGIKDNQEVADFFWDGKKWAISVKETNDDVVNFTYFYWEPLVNIVDLSPALSKESFLFIPSSEDEHKELNVPNMFSAAPNGLKQLVSSIPSSYTLFLKWRDDSGTSPVSYYQQGKTDIPLNAFASDFAQSGYTAAIFADGTTYLYIKDADRTVAFRLPKLPSGFVYGEGAMSGSYLYVSWEETNFYETGRSGFIKLNIEDVLALLD